MACGMQDGSEVYYRYIKDKKMQYLFMEYCKEKNLYYQSVVFLYDGRRVASNRTPLEVINLINFGSIINFIEIMD